jgi:ferredoxin-thioredoxin reductase catalytic subunit/rhodanese-related sulfurtransferase
MPKIDMDSPEFKKELAKTVEFTGKVIKQFGFMYNPNAEIVEGIQLGLTRNKLIYNKRFCPCFFVTQTPEDRICPCKPALGHEIKEDGRCHCQIFCTPEYVAGLVKEAEEEQKKKSEGVISAKECESILSKKTINCKELVELMAARDAGVCKFTLVDVREAMEHKRSRIKGTDYLVPASEFDKAIHKLDNKKNEYIITYCASGGRSAYCNHMKKDLGFKKVINLGDGIIGYKGEIERG